MDLSKKLLTNLNLNLLNNNIIYGLCDPISNDVRYIGKAINLHIRIKKHYSYSKLKYNTHKNNWLKLLLEKGYVVKVIILEECESKEFLNEAEIKWIKYYKSIGCNLTNATEGGDGGIMSKESINKGIETKKKNGTNIGWWKDKKFSKEHSDNISKGKKGYIASDETCSNLSKSHKGLNTWSKGRKLSKATINNMVKSKVGKARNLLEVYQMTLDNKIIKLWPCPLKAETILKLSHSKIHSVCTGKRKTTGGFKWCYKKDYID